MACVQVIRRSHLVCGNNLDLRLTARSNRPSRFAFSEFVEKLTGQLEYTLSVTDRLVDAHGLESDEGAEESAHENASTQ